MRSFAVKILALAVMAVMVVPALAQRRTGGRGFGRPRHALLSETVQKELKLTDEQKKTFQEVARTALSKAMDKSAADTLTSEQKKRYREIQLQFLGTRAYLEEDVQKALGMKENQKKAMASLIELATKERSKLFEEMRRTRNFREIGSKFQKLAEKVKEKTEKILTKRQREKFDTLLGKKLELRRRTGGGRPGRPGGDRPGRPRRPGGGDRPSRPSRPDA